MPYFSNQAALFILATVWVLSLSAGEVVEAADPPDGFPAAVVAGEGGRMGPVGQVGVEAGVEAADPVGEEVGKASGNWLDRYRATFKNQLDRSADWMDGVLGSDSFDDDPEDTSGRVSVKAFWQDRSGWELDTRFKVQVNLDNANRRLNAIAGRGDEKDLVGDRYGANARFASFYQGGVSDDWLAGVGYTPNWSRSGRISIGGGVSFSSTVAPYVNLNYRYRYLSEDGKFLAGFYQTFFYQTDEGLGSKTTIEPGYLVREDWLVNWYNSFEVGDTPDGMIWRSVLSIYQDLQRHRAIAYEFGTYVETGREVPVANFIASVTYRQQMFREWLYGEVTVGVAFPRDDPDWERKGDLVLGMGIEFFFGD